MTGDWWSAPKLPFRPLEGESEKVLLFYLTDLFLITTLPSMKKTIYLTVKVEVESNKKLEEADIDSVVDEMDYSVSSNTSGVLFTDHELLGWEDATKRND